VAEGAQCREAREGIRVPCRLLSEKMMWGINDMITLKWGRILLPGLKYK
jgi:hypothetical protein